MAEENNTSEEMLNEIIGESNTTDSPVNDMDIIEDVFADLDIKFIGDENSEGEDNLLDGILEEVNRSPEAETQPDEVPDEPSHGESESESPIAEGDGDVSGEANETTGQITLFDGEREVHLGADTEIEIIVDGEPQKVKLSDFRNDLSGQQAISRRFSALDQERKALEAKVQGWNEAESRVSELLGKGDVASAFDLILDKAGFNSEEVMLGFFQQISEPLKNYMELPEDQKALWAERVRAEKNRMQYEKLKSENDKLQSEQAQLEQVQKIQAQYGMSDEDFVESYGKLQEEMAQGTLAQREITPELVAQYHVLIQDENMAVDALKSVVPDKADNAKVVANVVEDIRHLRRKGMEVTPEKVAQMVRDEYAAKAKAVNKAVEKKAKGTPLQEKPRPKSPAAKTGVNFLDKLVDDLNQMSPQQTSEYMKKVNEQYRL